MTRLEALLQDFKDAVSGLEAVLKERKTEFIRDAAIKRFELAFDLSWKALKALFEEKGIVCASPLGCFKEAFRQNLIDYEDFWIEMIQTRNKTVHTYNERLAEEVYATLPKTLEAMKKLLSAIDKEASQDRRPL